MTIKTEVPKEDGLQRNQYQGHIVWCLRKDIASQCYGVNFFSMESYDTKWISRILNDPTLQYVCRWCKTKGSFNSIMFMNDELSPSFYADFKRGNIDKCVSHVSKFLWANGHKVKKATLKTIMIELEESLKDED